MKRMIHQMIWLLVFSLLLAAMHTGLAKAVLPSDDSARYTQSAWLTTPEENPAAAERYLDLYSPGTVLYLPDFTGTDSEWVVNSVTAGDQYVRVTSVPVNMNQFAEGANPKSVYEIRMEGVTPEDAYIWLDLCKDDEVSWRYNIYVIVDESLDVKIQYAELLRWPVDISDVRIDYGTSECFTREDMDQAIAIILRDFSTYWPGFTVHEIRYTSDTESQRDFERNKNTHGTDSQGQPYVEGIVFESSFHTPMTDDGMTGFKTGEWDDYHWTLLRTEGGKWDIVNQGYN